MKTVNVMQMNCPLPQAFAYGRQVQRWPELLPHYRWVRFHHGNSEDGGRVEMAAHRDFGRVAWPVWWVSEMAVDHAAPAVSYQHVAGVTRGMEVQWQFRAVTAGTEVTIVHEWPRPWLGRLLACELVGPVFVHAVAGRTLAGLKRWADVTREVTHRG